MMGLSPNPTPVHVSVCNSLQLQFQQRSRPVFRGVWCVATTIAEIVTLCTHPLRVPAVFIVNDQRCFIRFFSTQSAWCYSVHAAATGRPTSSRLLAHPRRHRPNEYSYQLCLNWQRGFYKRKYGSYVVLNWQPSVLKTTTNGIKIAN